MEEQQIIENTEGNAEEKKEVHSVILWRSVSRLLLLFL